MINLTPVEAQEPNTTIRELDHRRNDEIEVTLLWDTKTQDVFIVVTERDGNSFEFQVSPTDARDAFHHPYAYAAYRDSRTPLAA
jgi:hypothetical protein